MPPRPRPTRKISVPKDSAPIVPPPKSQHAAQAMPPPPDPLPQGILVPEITALPQCLRNAVVKTGQIYGFYADTVRLGIHRYAPYPPRSLTAALGREVEKYDQLCDAIESRLLRAIAVLEREQRRLKAASIEIPVEPSVPVSASPPASPGPDTDTVLPESSTANTQQQPPKSQGPPRRQSTISLSSLHRPPFPHKLDLSSAALRLNPEDLPSQSALASPVTLAPKSTVSMAPPPSDMIGRDVDIDLTIAEDREVNVAVQGPTASSSATSEFDPALGSSADKPIELDLDMDMDLFGEESGTAATGHIDAVKPKQESEQLNMALLHDFSAAPHGGVDPHKSQGMSTLNVLQHNNSMGPNQTASSPNPLSQQQRATAGTVPTPASLLAGLHPTATMNPNVHSNNGNGGQQAFDFDLGFLEHAAAMDMQMEDLFNVESVGGPSSGS